MSGETDLQKDAGPDRGPCHSLTQYCNTLIRIGKSRIPKVEPETYLLPYQGSLEDHKALLADSKPVLERLIQLPQIQKAGIPTLMHYDLNKRNIFVSDIDPTVITGVIDWQSTSVEPGFIYANEIPDFTTSSTDPSELFSEDVDEGTPHTASNQDSVEDARICSSTFEVILKGLAPKIGLGRSLNEILLRPFRYAATSWRDSATAGRQELVELFEKWNRELELPGSCPYQPSPEQLQTHRDRYETFETAQKLKHWLVTMLRTSSDGWVPADAWDAARAANKAAFEQWMQSAKESQEMDEQQARALWPFEEMGD
ncbi:putative serine threonine protein kinase [Phaeomoniella chlamydospora]|uniref:Putative serine threonine protein kinase n=1 Tax=Phaeomoniella chlamydospora TaxID=158046 RepID=A0A0G2E7Z3_PHACM|nr:putative serine threonine protein kinase [Phaeomoniella chlamydospora]